MSIQRPRLCCLLASIALLVGGTTVQAADAVDADGFKGVWYNIAGGTIPGGTKYPNKYGGGLATYPQQIAPLAIYSEEQNKTYFTFSLNLPKPTKPTNVAHVLSYYDHDTGLVARPKVWLDKNSTDAHDAPVLSIDGDGYIYMFSNTHGESGRSYVRRSTNPYDISSYTDLVNSSSADMAVFGSLPGDTSPNPEPRFSYSNAWYVPNVESDNKLLMLHTRYNDGSQRDLFSTTSADGDTWTERKGYAQIERGQYQTSWIKPDGKTIGVIFNVHPTNVDTRTDLYYMETSDQAGTWKAIDGTLILNNTAAGSGTPLMSRPAAARVYDAADNERVYLKDVNYDANGNPVLMYLTAMHHDSGPLNGNAASPPDRQVWTARWNGSEWVRKPVVKTDNNYDHGSLFVEDDGTWRIIAPFITGPQAWGTGGQMGMWVSTDQGDSWELVDQLTDDPDFNHTYARRVLNGQDDFYTFWANGNAWTKSEVGIFFSDKNGNVYQLPANMDSDFAAPILIHEGIPEPASMALLGLGGLLLFRRRR